MGGGVSKASMRSFKESVRPSVISSARQAASQHEAIKPASASDGRRESTKLPTSIDARIVSTLRQLNLTQRADPKKGRAMHFERIVLQFALVRDAFTTIRAIYIQFASPDGLTFEGLKAALNAMGAQIKESDTSEIFYESDMVRDNSLSQNEFVVSLAIAHLLGLITNFDSIKNALVRAPEDVTLIPVTPPEEQPADGGNASKLIAKALDLMITAYLLFDNDASGTIQTNEVLGQMRQNLNGATSPRRLERLASGLSSKAIQDERIKELDFDRDGTITFQEFVLTFQRWAGSDNDDEE